MISAAFVTECSEVVFVKTIATERDKKSSIFQKNWKFVTVFTKAPPPVPYLKTSDCNCLKKL